jgi:acetoacetyl-CoA synthetase
MSSGAQASGIELWRPSAERVSKTNMVAFAELAGLPLSLLHRWSIDDPEGFWSLLWEFTLMVGEPWADGADGPAFVAGGSIRQDRFFPNARLNIATNLLARTGSADAVVAYGESGEPDEALRRRSLSWDELRIEVGACATGLRSLGVLPGDRVCAYLPNGIEVIVVMVATASLGATFSSASPDFGTTGVLDRFSQIDPVVLFGCTSYSYGGKSFDTSSRLAEIQAGLPTLKAVVVVGPQPFAGQSEGLANSDTYEDFLAPHRGSSVPDDLYPYDQPWYIMYSSGTTGKPKCFIHRAGGLLLQHRKEHSLHCDLRAGDVALYFTTTGWMMWNWLVSALATGCTVVCVDGSPFEPTPSLLFDLVDREGVTLLGVGAKFIDAIRKEGLVPKASHDLTSLRSLCSTGSPLSAESFAYVYDSIKGDVHLASISGGTDLCACFVLGDPTRGVFAGEIQSPGLGMAVQVWDDRGESLASRPGERGELVCTQSFPSMPIGFWDDGDGSRYQAAYFDRFPSVDVWAHGDFAAHTEQGGFIIHGRSDATLNPGGVRIGTAEITRQVELDPTIAESLVFAQDWEDDSRIVLLVRMVAGASLSAAGVADLKLRIRVNCSPRHVPALVLAVDDLPRTRSGKLTELAVGDAVNGREVRNTEAIANPEALWAIAGRPELARASPS